MNEPRPQDQGPDQGEKPAQNTPSIEAMIKSSLLITALIMAAIIIAHRAGIIETEMEVLDVMRTAAKMFATLTSSRPSGAGTPHTSTCAMRMETEWYASRGSPEQGTVAEAGEDSQ